MNLDTSKIDNILNKYLEKFDCTVFCGTDFSFYYSTNEIEYALMVSERMNNLFLEFARKCGLQGECDIFLLSLMHEVGHSETLDEIEDTEYYYSRDVKKNLTCSNEDCETYFNLPDEIAATQWAVDYINSHSTEIKELWSKLQPEIMNFYVANGLI